MSSFEYTGQENLEAMKYAKNYNKYLIDTILKAVNKTGKKLKILDFGAGIGTYADMLKDEDITVECFEIDMSQVKLLRKKGYQVFNDIRQLDEYDLIYSFNVFEHIENDIEVFASLAKRLKKGGKIMTYVPAFQSLYSSMDKLVGHERRYKKGRLEKMSKESDLRVLELRYCDPLGYFASLAFKVLGNDNGTISPNSVKIYDKFVFVPSRTIEKLVDLPFGKNALMLAERR